MEDRTVHQGQGIAEPAGPAAAKHHLQARNERQEARLRSVLIHEPTGQQFDLAGFINAEIFEWLESVRGYRFRCGQCQGPLYLRHNPGYQDRLHGVHRSDSDCQELVVRRGAPMTDAHKRQCEYTALAAEAGGSSADFEFTTTGRTRVDVVVDGRLGFEIQHSDASVDKVRSRTARSMASGLEAVSWFTDRDPPVWWGVVPSYGTTERRWDRMMPPLGTVRAFGPRLIEAVTCTWDMFIRGRCPDGKSRPCGKRHPRERGVSLLVDEVVTRMAAGELVQARFGKYARLTDRASLSLYEELTGVSALYGASLPPLRIQEPVNGRIECERPIFWRFPGGSQLELDFSAKSRDWCTKCGAYMPANPCSRCGTRSVIPDVPGIQKRMEKRELEFLRTLQKEQPALCNIPGCGDYGRLYMVGLRCEKHQPQPRLRMVG